MARDLFHVYAPLQVGPLTFRNRIFVPAHTTNFGEDHMPGDRHLAYHVARARGGVAAIIFESIRVHENSLGRPAAVSGFDPRCVPSFARITAAVRAEGAAMLGQIIHLGRHIDGDFERTVSWGASPLPWSGTAPPPHAMDEDDMADVVDGHVATAHNLVAAGFDGIELQVGHGHLLQQFLSPLSNQREDHYGGSLENRMRFPLAVLAAVRAEVGPRYCLGIRVSAEEYVEEGIHVDEMVCVVLAFARHTPIDFVNVSHSAYHASYSLATQMADMAFDPTPFRDLPYRVRTGLRTAGFDIPVFGVCRFTSLAQAEAAIAAGQADAIGIARAHIAEPAIVRKTMDGRVDEVRPCIACNQGCAGMLEKNIPIRCLVSPRAGLETRWAEPEDDRATVARDVLVIGGGPAGMEAAWVSAARGHRVMLWERDARLGGQLNWLRHMPKRGEFLKLVDYQEARLRRHGVAVRLNVDADDADVASLKADLVIVATGSRPAPFRLPGDGLIHTMEAAIAEPDRLGTDVAFADLTGDWGALAAIEHLADRGKHITVFSPVAGFAWRTTSYSTLANTVRLRAKGVRLAPLRRLRRWDGDILQVEDVSTGGSETFATFDDLVVAYHNEVNDALYTALRRRGVAARRIGDCVAPRTAMEAVHQGHAVAREI